MNKYLYTFSNVCEKEMEKFMRHLFKEKTGRKRAKRRCWCKEKRIEVQTSDGLLGVIYRHCKVDNDF